MPIDSALRPIPAASAAGCGMGIAYHVIRLTQAESAIWHHADVRAWAPFRRAWRERLATEALQRHAFVELQDVDGQPLEVRLTVGWASEPTAGA